MANVKSFDHEFSFYREDRWKLISRLNTLNNARLISLCHYAFPFKDLFSIVFVIRDSSIRSEFELLESDMKTLRDAVIAREEAWDKAVEREQNCQQQLARLTAEVITARHLCETRQDELRVVTDTLAVISITDTVRSVAYIEEIETRMLD